jgi:hypothetical protein
MCDRKSLKKKIPASTIHPSWGALVGVGALWPFGGVLVHAGSLWPFKQTLVLS